MATNPAEQPSKSTAPDRQYFQFTLRTLLELTAVVGLGCSLYAWGGKPVARIPEFFLAAGVVLIVLGIEIRRGTWILGGLLILIWLWTVVNIWNSKPHDPLYESCEVGLLQPNHAVPAIDVDRFAGDAGREIA
jgi:hypothetical protein